MNIKNGKKRIVYAIAWLLTVSFLLTDTLSVLAANVNYSYDKSLPQINADSDVKTGKAFEPGDRICFNESNAEAPAGEGEISYKKADGTSLTQEVLGIAAFPYVGTADPSGNSLMLPAFQTNGCTKWKVSEADVYTLGDAKKIKLTLIEAYEIEWNLNGGTSTLSFNEAYAPSETLTLDTPTKANSIFDGWTYQFEGDQTATTLAANSTGSYPIPLTGKSGKLTITAVWKRPYVPYIPVIDWEENKDDEKSHRITYVLGEGATNDASNPATYYEGSGVAELKPAVKPNYDFEGWYEDEACTKKVDSISASSTGDVTVYASFTPKKFKITYVLDGGVNSDKNPTTYTYGEGIKYLEKPKKKAYDCRGWYWRSGGYGSPVESISNKQSGDITLYAYYIPVPDLTGATIRLDQYEFKYTGKERKVGIYDIKLADGMMFSRINNVKITGDRATDIGEHILTMTGDGDRVTGSCSVVYTIKKIDLETEVDVSFDKESFTYKKGKKQKPKVTLKLKSSGKEVSSDWYSVEYPEDQVNAGEKNIRISPKGKKYCKNSINVKYTIKRAPTSFKLSFTTKKYKISSLENGTSKITVTITRNDDGLGGVISGELQSINCTSLKKKIKVTKVKDDDTKDNEEKFTVTLDKKSNWKQCQMKLKFTAKGSENLNNTSHTCIVKVVN